MAKETALQELIRRLKNLSEKNPFDTGLKVSIEIAKTLIETEKNQIVNAVDYTYNEHDYHTTGELYYIETFKKENYMQTSIELFIKEISKHINIDEIPPKIIDKAFEIHQKEIILSWENGSLPNILNEYSSAYQYYRNTYKKNQDETI